MICAGCREQPHTEADCEDTQRGCDYRGCGCQHRTPEPVAAEDEPTADE